MLLLASAASLTCTDTTLVVELLPSGKLQTKLPPPVLVTALPTCVPLLPQLVETRVNESGTSTSTTEKVYVCWLPSVVDNVLPADSVTAGASLTEVMLIVNVAVFESAKP